HLLCGLGLVLGVQAAATAAWWVEDGWLGYHVLTAAWAVTAAAVVATRWTAGPAEPDRPRGAWVTALGLLVVSLALRGVGLDPAGPWWSAGAVAAVAALSAAMALRDRHEGWAFAACVGVNLAVSLVLRHAYQGEDLQGWWVRLVQVNVLAAALTALLWQAL